MTGLIGTAVRPTAVRAATSTPTGTPAAIAALVAAVVVAGALSLLVGSRTISPAAIWDATHPAHFIVDARVARTLMALAVGGALGLAGALLQGLTRNPLADPGILGINAGASFAMVLAISAFGVSSLAGYLWFAFAGAGVATVAVHAVAGLGRDGATPMKLAIAGAALTAALTSWTSAVLLTDRRTLETFRFWQVGTVGGRSLEVLSAGLPFLAAGVALALAGMRVLDVLALGDDVARGLGRRTARDRLLLGLAVVLLAGTATALAGPVAFVGLIVPHAVRAVLGPGSRRLLPFSLGYGAVLTVLADTLGRVVLPPTEVQVGIMTAVVGVPVLLGLIRRGPA
jgi:iron complex transport system permease protein